MVPCVLGVRDGILIAKFFRALNQNHHVSVIKNILLLLFLLTILA